MRRAVTLIDKPPPEPPQTSGKRLFNFRMDAELHDYLDDAARKTESDKTKVLVRAVRLDRAIGRRLTKYRDELRAYAETKGLKTHDPDELAEVIAELVKVGLAEWRKSKR